MDQNSISIFVYDKLYSLFGSWEIFGREEGGGGGEDLDFLTISTIQT